jgi:hypothetical protein
MRAGRPQGQAAPGAARSERSDRAAREAFRTRVRDLRERQMADVRALLTADQRATFDRNLAEMRTRAASDQRGARRDGVGRGRRGERGAR